MEAPINADAPIPLIAKGDAEPVPTPAMPPVAPTASPTPAKRRRGGWGDLIGVVLIVFLIVLAAFYSWGERLAIEETAAVSE